MLNIWLIAINIILLQIVVFYVAYWYGYTATDTEYKTKDSNTAKTRNQKRPSDQKQEIQKTQVTPTVSVPPTSGTTATPSHLTRSTANSEYVQQRHKALRYKPPAPQMPLSTSLNLNGNQPLYNESTFRLTELPDLTKYWIGKPIILPTKGEDQELTPYTWTSQMKSAFPKRRRRRSTQKFRKQLQQIKQFKEDQFLETEKKDQSPAKTSTHKKFKNQKLLRKIKERMKKIRSGLKKTRTSKLLATTRRRVNKGSKLRVLTPTTKYDNRPRFQPSNQEQDHTDLFVQGFGLKKNILFQNEHQQSRICAVMNI